MDNIIFVIQTIAFFIITAIMILKVSFKPDKIDEDDKNEVISFLTIVKEKLANEDLVELGIGDLRDDEYKSKIPKTYQDYHTFYNEGLFPAEDSKPTKKRNAYVILTNFLILIIIIALINIIALIPLISPFIMFMILVLPYAIFNTLRENKGKTKWHILVHPNERTDSIFLQFFSIFFFLSLFISTMILISHNEESFSVGSFLVILSIYPVFMCLYLFLYKMYYQYQWKKQWNRIFALIAKKSIADRDLFNYTIAKDYQNKIENYSVFPIGDKAKIYLVTMGLIQTAIFLSYKIVEIGKPYFEMVF